MLTKSTRDLAKPDALSFFCTIYRVHNLYPCHSTIVEDTMPCDKEEPRKALTVPIGSPSMWGTPIALCL